MAPEFHLSIGVKSLEDSLDFFVSLLSAKVTHRDPSGYVNLELFNTQITLKQNPEIQPNLPDFHFGFNLSLADFDALSQKVLHEGKRYITLEPKIVDPGTPLERKKMYLKDPTGYVIELKGYRR